VEEKRLQDRYRKAGEGSNRSNKRVGLKNGEKEAKNKQ
jgi:hypothetical protein